MPQPDNVATLQWVVIGVLSTVVVAMAAYIRSLHTELRQSDKDHYNQNLALTEKVLTAGLEMKEVARDTNEAINLLSGKLDRQNRARTVNNGNKKTSQVTR